MDLKRINGKRDIFKLRTDVKREKTSFEKRAETLFELAETNAKLKKGLGTSIVVILVLCLVLAYFAIRTNIKVFLVQVDKTTGAPMEVNVLTKSNLKVGEKETKYFISKFYRYFRGLLYK